MRSVEDRDGWSFWLGVGAECWVSCGFDVFYAGRCRLELLGLVFGFLPFCGITDRLDAAAGGGSTRRSSQS